MKELDRQLLALPFRDVAGVSWRDYGKKEGSLVIKLTEIGEPRTVRHCCPDQE